MKHGSLVIEKKEYVILKRMLNLSGYHHDSTLRKSVGNLSKEMKSARICDEADMPEDVVRLNSMVTIASEHGWYKKFQLVVPKERDVKNDKISLLTPMGAAVMGYAEGDSLVWEFPSGEQKLTIEKVKQEKKHININTVL
tara:strand:+ start:12151 stop:12570 length:420 start_codon:yes stop_codon:yes gene_type:complete